MAPSSLALFWAAVIAFAILMYAILDGFDLGVGILFGWTKDESLRVQMMDSIAPFWDGNETWLVVIGAGLFAAFPQVYAVFLGVFYLPVLFLLFGLIFRGIAFEFRFRSTRTRWLWDLGFTVGSTVVAFVQGAAVGAMMRGIPVTDGYYHGGSFSWLHPFAILSGIGVVLGYALLGAGWLALKNTGRIRDWAYARIRKLVVAILVVMVVAFAFAFDFSSVAARSGLHERPAGLVFPAIALLALFAILAGARGKRDGAPFALAVLFFFASWLTLIVTFWPYMIPYSITVAEAAAPDVSLQFIFWGALIVLPIILTYTLAIYLVFRGKIQKGEISLSDPTPARPGDVGVAAPGSGRTPGRV
jgi:cytochrome d ubiquinol oxidase subunit II